MNVGVLGGTFDPIHNGHLLIAEEARARLNLTVVFLVPAGQPWQKTDRDILPAEHRLPMVRLAIADKPHFQLTTLEIERAGPTYTIDTIVALRKQFSSRDELFFILGWDSLSGFHEWREAARLIQLCYLAAVPRPGYVRPDLKTLEANLPGLSQRVMLMDEPHVDISATEIRERVAKRLSIHHLVPGPVNKYIKQHKLYLTE